jgi:hypothetical protein
MNISDLFVRAWRFTWGHKMLWILGLFSGLTGLAIDFLLRIPARWLISTTSIEELLDGLATQSGQIFLLASLIGGTIALFILGILIWLIGAAAEGGIIYSISRLEVGRTVSFRHAWRAGFGYIGRLIAIDTIIFLPLFVLLMLGLLLASGAMFGAVIMAAEPANDVSSILTLLTAIGGGVLALLCLAAPIAIFTFLLRFLAFRAAIVEDLAARESISRAWKIMRANPGSVLALALLLWVLGYLVGLPAGLADLSAMAFSLLPELFPSLQMDLLLSAETILSIISTILSILAILIGAVISAFSITTWTLAYAGWSNDLPSPQDAAQSILT